MPSSRDQSEDKHAKRRLQVRIQRLALIVVVLGGATGLLLLWNRRKVHRLHRHHPGHHIGEKNGGIERLISRAAMHGGHQDAEGEGGGELDTKKLKKFMRTRQKQVDERKAKLEAAIHGRNNKNEPPRTKTQEEDGLPVVNEGNQHHGKTLHKKKPRYSNGEGAETAVLAEAAKEKAD